ncbi:DEAD/DEAH box helicase family protein [Lysinibacillus sp. LZ02]|uniref:DEAD/DEAH box helicase family protein n=1 Tax=Lysinibacillus sp. LZ02 TaxID=3420668 RepID=UPI003D35E405
MNELKDLSEEAVHICWITAFAMKSGVNLMLPTLKKASERGAEIQLLVGDYLSITQPEALRTLLANLPQAEIRLYRTYGRSFHPKAYLFRHEGSQHVIVGSSNLSRSALTTGIEWSLHTIDLPTFEQSMDEFNRVFYSENTIPVNKVSIDDYEKQYKEANRVMALSDKWSEAEEVGFMYGTESKASIAKDEKLEVTVLEPRPAQKLALSALKATLQQGYDKAMAVLATGLGKTYLAAFFAEHFKRVLFVAHRDEILEQAREAFLHVHPNRTTGYYNGIEKNTDADMLFASVYTIAQKQHLAKFNEDAFDLIVIDEFHHAAAPTYNRLIEYFKPSFLLGITATPDRLDNKDVYAICDGNVAIEVHFLDAIAHKWLSPFHYYGIRDEIDYAQIRWLGTGYDEEQLTAAQLQEDVVNKIYENWLKYKQTRTIGFCSSVKQATYLTNYFAMQGVKAEVLTGGNTRGERKKIREQLIQGEIDLIFTVDLFNEGVDIPTVDTLLFVRPTESIAIFTQQIGRGLRLAEGKSHCVIIDCIGNYRNADRKLRLFYPELLPNKKFIPEHTHMIPGTGCVVNIDLDVIDLLKEIIKKNSSYKEQIMDAYMNVKAELGRRPSYLEMYLQSGFYDINIAREFGSYISMLKQAEELTAEELAAFDKHEQILVEIEKTAMTKSYKMVLLKGMLERGAANWYKAITASELAPTFAQYLAHPTRSQIDPIDLTDKKVISLLEKMPMTKWSGSSKGLLYFEDGTFGFNVEIERSMQEIMYGWVKEICEFRLNRYFARKAEKGKLN